MKTRLNTALVLSSILASLALTASARAEDCTTEAQATPANVYDCKIDQNAQARLVAGWLSSAEIQATPDFEKLLGGVGNFYTPQRSILDPVFERLLAMSDEKLPLAKKIAVIDNARDLDGKTTPAVLAFVKKRLLSSERYCTTQDVVILRYRDAFPKNDADISRSIGQGMRYCSWSYPNEFQAFASTVGEGYRAGVLPLMDTLNGYLSEIVAKPDTDCEGVGNGSTWKHDYQATVIQGLYALGEGRVERAQTLVQSFQGVKCRAIGNAANEAMGKIQTGINLKNAARGNATAIDWGMDFLQSHNGNYEGVEAEIIDAFFQAAKVNATAKAKIKRFARDEYASGYHSGAPKMNARLKQLSQL